MGQITNGKVAYSRTVKTGDYENKKCEAELQFSVNEGEAYDDVFAAAGAAAVSKVHELLGLAPRTQPAPQAAPVAVAQQPAQTGTSDKDRLAAQATATASAPAAARKPRATKPPAAATDPASIDEPQTLAAEMAAKAATQPAADPAGIDEDLFSAEATEITDADLMNHITKTNGRVKDAKGIRNLIGKYVPSPGQAKDIPQASRKAFFTELDKMPDAPKA